MLFRSGEEFIDILKTIHKLGLDRTDRVDVKGVAVSPRDLLTASLPDPATLGSRMKGKTCAGALVRDRKHDVAVPLGDRAVACNSVITGEISKLIQSLPEICGVIERMVPMVTVVMVSFSNVWEVVE